jgi:predicted Zn-dependent protease
MSEPIVVEGIIPVSQGEIALLLESGYLYMEMQKFKEAEEIFAGVAALIPHSEVPLICLGNLQFSQGRYERALKFQKEALVRQPNSALAQAHIGEALLFLKKRPEAKVALEKEEGDAAAFARALLDGSAAGVV